MSERNGNGRQPYRSGNGSWINPEGERGPNGVAATESHDIQLIGRVAGTTEPSREWRGGKIERSPDWDDGSPQTFIEIGDAAIPWTWRDGGEIYVRRITSPGLGTRVSEIVIATHDGPASEHLDCLNLQAEESGDPRQFWREFHSEMDDEQFSDFWGGE